MGVPGLFAWLRKRYPEISSPLIKKKDGTYTGIRGKVDNLYIDTNHIIHACAHGSVAKGRDRLTEQQVFARMEAYLEALLEATQPQKLVFCAVDGVAPQAKQAQQRTRRFLSAYVAEVTDETEKEIRREMLSETGGSVEVPHISRFDSNQITPGTVFMAAVADFLAKWFRAKVARDPRFANLVVMVSDASEPAEGEHKIMRFIRAARLDPAYNPHTRHCIYGQDADLLLLGLLSHEPNFVVLREDMAAKSPPPLKPSNQGGTKPLGEGKQTKLDLANTTARAIPAGTSATTDTASAVGPGASGGLEGVAGSSTNPAAGVATNAAGAAGAGSGPKPELHGSNLQGVVPCFEQVDIGVLRDCIHWEFEEFLGSPDGCSIDELLLGGEATFRFGIPTNSHAQTATSTPSRKQKQQQQQQHQQQADTSAAANFAADLPHREWYPPEAYFLDSKGCRRMCLPLVQGQETQQPHSHTGTDSCVEAEAGGRSTGGHPSQQQQQQQQQEGPSATSSIGAARPSAASQELPAAASPTFAGVSIFYVATGNKGNKGRSSGQL
ncbi:XRN 5'-3' exonuclease N-terminus-domain-containing protein [Dunaliella salina]|uniref:XRN 5'-3' exonuclease N-terminus-domain-containing protein n=1 Tax=Dunaliella salina TaxID=3046 RepID=A0ABQ7FXF8_DUNSA|nr:XRN 5'-3' exonuclease N-terminus-domain-containing protein [Dunaliella salina]|eukprot:KAF5827040.1 XRN 5'-3' exonuclease N-terminus-domain-containing protein [Dunaliella salina]